MKQFVTKFFLQLLILLLVLIVVVQNIWLKPKVIPTPPVIIRDTVEVVVSGGASSYPHLAFSIPYPYTRIIEDTKYLPDTNYAKLQKQYIDLLLLYFQKNVERDTLKLGNNGFVYVTDTVSKNMLSERVYNYKITYPEITNTVITEKNRFQLYMGGSIEGNINQPVNRINHGILVKTKNDHLYGVYHGMDMTGKYQIGVQSYWKVSFRKKK